MAIAQSLKTYLKEQGVQYEVVRHAHTESSSHSAAGLSPVKSCKSFP